MSQDTSKCVSGSIYAELPKDDGRGWQATLSLHMFVDPSQSDPDKRLVLCQRYWAKYGELEFIWVRVPMSVLPKEGIRQQVVLPAC